MDVFEFEIDSGKSTRELSSDIFEIADVEITNSDDLNEKVVKTIKNGYENIHPNGKNVLMKAKIIVYKKGVKMSNIVGIDLGTTFSAINWMILEDQKLLIT